jgi:tRNA C32,U32 (ribose-2'-O)-methylase TrmJ
MKKKIGKQILHPHMRKKQINHFRKKMDKVLESVKVSQKKGETQLKRSSNRPGRSRTDSRGLRSFTPIENSFPISWGFSKIDISKSH